MGHPGNATALEVGRTHRETQHTIGDKSIHRPAREKKTRGRPPATWDHIIRKFANESLGLEQETWTNIAQNRQTWSSLEEVFTDYVKETFVQKRTRTTLEADET